MPLRSPPLPPNSPPPRPPRQANWSGSADADSLQANPALQAVIKEVSALVDLIQHPNIIRFVGVCVDPPRIVTEYYK